LVAAWPPPACKTALFTEELEVDALLLVVTDGFVDTRKVTDTLTDATVM
jgi:hypothetical protein